MFAASPCNKVVLITQQPLLLATINRRNIDHMTRVLFKVFLERAKLELNCRISEVQQAIRHVYVLKGAAQSHDCGVVAEVYDQAFWVSRRRSTWWSYLVGVVSTTVGTVS